MPRISAASNAEQRAETQRRILTAFGELLFSHGLPGVGRTAVYNYYADIEELLISYALEETEKFLSELREALGRLDNPVERLALYVRAQVVDLSRRHLPPGPAMGAVLSPSSFAKLADHVGELSVLLQGILRDGMEQGLARCPPARPGAATSPRNWKPGWPGQCALSSWARERGSTTPAARSALRPFPLWPAELPLSFGPCQAG
jgi:AcrR family transcriptional regulator